MNEPRSEVERDVRRPLAYVGAFVVLVVTLAFTLWPTLRFLAVSVPPTKGEWLDWVSWQQWLSHREWYVFFACLNGLWFAWSLHSVLARDNREVLSTLLEHFFVVVQAALIFGAAGLVVGQQPDGHVILEFNEETFARWVVSVTLALFANALATVDTFRSIYRREIDLFKSLIWVGLNSGCLSFFGLIAYFGLSREYSLLMSSQVASLWLIAIPIIFLLACDFFHAGGMKPKSL